MINTVHTGFYSLRALRALDLILSVIRPAYVHSSSLHVYRNKKIAVTTTGELCMKIDDIDDDYYKGIFQRFIDFTEKTSYKQDSVIYDALEICAYVTGKIEKIDASLKGEPLVDPFKICAIEYHFNECRMIFENPDIGLTEAEILMQPHFNEIKELFDKK